METTYLSEHFTILHGNFKCNKTSRRIKQDITMRNKYNGRLLPNKPVVKLGLRIFFIANNSTNRFSGIIINKYLPDLIKNSTFANDMT